MNVLIIIKIINKQKDNLEPKIYEVEEEEEEKNQEGSNILWEEKWNAFEFIYKHPNPHLYINMINIFQNNTIAPSAKIEKARNREIQKILILSSSSSSSASNKKKSKPPL